MKDTLSSALRNLAACLAIISIPAHAVAERHTQYVDVFIGTSYTGHTSPAACVPFGLVQAGPETGNTGWDYCAGYRYDDRTMIGFAQDHLNGTGSTDLGDVLLFPFAGDAPNGFKSGFSKDSEKASPGYYRVSLDDSRVDAQATATEHVALYDFAYRAPVARMLVNLQNGTVNTLDALRHHVLDSRLSLPNDTTIEGWLRTSHWCERQTFFAIRFSTPYRVDSVLAPLNGERAHKLVLSFPAVGQGGHVAVKVALSTVSNAGAQASLLSECPNWDFDAVRRQADEAWEEILSRADIEASDNNRTMFYTSLYRTAMQPNNIADGDGLYRGADDSVHHATGRRHYSTFSLWDTFRATHPLYTILMPERVADMVNSLLDFCDVRGVLPIWSLWGKETYGMIANHAVPVVAEACLKGFDVNNERAFNAIRATLTKPHRKSDWRVYLKYGYYPNDIVKVESVSRTLESCYDDWCAAQLAKSLGRKADYKTFMRRSGFWKNVFDSRVGLMRGRDSLGRWREPFDPLRIGHWKSGGDFTEGNSRQYTWQVMHDPFGLMRAMGGRKQFCTNLDSLFTITEVSKNNTGPTVDVTGLIGQYAHGNEPCHHVAYLYALAGQPWKTQSLIRRICDEFYRSRPDGLSGNDDCGQMSAWYIFSALGFYPVSPVSLEYVLGAPQLSRATLRLGGGKTLTVEARGLSEANKFVERVTLNGRTLKSPVVSHADIVKGGRLVFYMTGKAPVGK